MMKEKKRGDTVKIEPISNGNLRIWLADNEIEEWRLEDSQGKGVRRLVRYALSSVGRRPVGRLWAEMIPVEGGCILLVSPAVHNPLQPLVYVLEEDALAQVRVRWRPSPEETAQVYALGEQYRVVLYGQRSDTLLREYGTPLGGGAGMAAHVAEYGRWMGEITEPAPRQPEHEGREP